LNNKEVAMQSFTPVGWNRRQFALALPALSLMNGVWAQTPMGQTVALRQTVALTGPLGDLGQALLQGAKLGFEEVNTKGGVHGRKIELVAQDDAYDVKKAMGNFEGFMADPSVFGLFGCFGTPIVAAMLPKVIESGVPFFAPYTGALVARAKAKNVMNIRASYPEEAERMVRHLSSLGIKKIAIVYQNNSFGKEFLEGAKAAMEKLGIPSLGEATVESDASDAGAAASKLAGVNPDAVLLGLAGKPTVEFVKAIRSTRKSINLYALSVMGTNSTLQALGADASGIAVTQVVPLPVVASSPVARDFLAGWKQANTAGEPSHTALEGYVNARVFAEILRRVGPKLTREAFIDAAWKLQKFDVGGFEVGFTEPGKNASQFVEITLISRSGKFIR
jgi:ABC-type branched-subunit amino acid transport system substrate-binding protein